MVDTIQEEQTTNTNEQNTTTTEDRTEELVKVLSSPNTFIRATLVLDECINVLKLNNIKSQLVVSNQEHSVLFLDHYIYKEKNYELDTSNLSYQKFAIKLDKIQEQMDVITEIENNLSESPYNFIGLKPSEKQVKIDKAKEDRDNLKPNQINLNINSDLKLKNSYRTLFYQHQELQKIIQDRTQPWWKKEKLFTPFIFYKLQNSNKQRLFAWSNHKFDKIALNRNNRFLSNLVIITGLQLLLHFDKQKYKDLQPIYEFYNTTAILGGIKKTINYKNI